MQRLGNSMGNRERCCNPDMCSLANSQIGRAGDHHVSAGLRQFRDQRQAIPGENIGAIYAYPLRLSVRHSQAAELAVTHWTVHRGQRIQRRRWCQADIRRSYWARSKAGSPVAGVMVVVRMVFFILIVIVCVRLVGRTPEPPPQPLANHDDHRQQDQTANQPHVQVGQKGQIGRLAAGLREDGQDDERIHLGCPWIGGMMATGVI